MLELTNIRCIRQAPTRDSNGTFTGMTVEGVPGQPADLARVGSALCSVARIRTTCHLDR